MRYKCLVLLLSAMLFAAGFAVSSCTTPDQPGTEITDDPDDPQTPDPDTPEDPDTPDPGNTDNPDDPDTPDPDNPDGPDTPDDPGEDPEPQTDPVITVLDPGKTAPEGGYKTPMYPDSLHVVEYSDFFNPVQDDLDEYGNIDYVIAQGFGTAWPIITEEGYIRMYQGSNASKGGSYIRVRAKNGAKLLSVTLGSSTATKIAYTLNGKAAKSSTEALDAGGKKTVETPQGASEVCFYCMGTSQSERMHVNFINVKYQGGFVEQDY